MPGPREFYATRFRITASLHQRSECLSEPACERNICVNSVVLAGEIGKPREEIVNGLIYIVGLIVVIMFILSFLGLR